MKNTEGVIKNVLGLIDQFGKEELGNRISNFSLIALRGAILQELNKLRELKEVADDEK